MLQINIPDFMRTRIESACMIGTEWDPVKSLFDAALAEIIRVLKYNLWGKFLVLHDKLIADRVSPSRSKESRGSPSNHAVAVVAKIPDVA